jgi:hypothetical protein
MAFTCFRYGVALALLASAGCAGHAGSLPSPELPQISAPAGRHANALKSAPDVPATVYLAVAANGRGEFINIYSNGGRNLSGKITNGLTQPAALAVDPATSTLYEGGDSAMEVYPGSNGRVRLYNGRLALPIGGYDFGSYQIPKMFPGEYASIQSEAVIGNSLYVSTNVFTTSGMGGKTYAAIAQLPLFSKLEDGFASSQRAFHVPELWCPSQMAGDGSGNVYVALVYLCGNSNPFRYQLREYAPGKSDGTVLPLPAAVSHTLGGMTLDGKGDLVACDREHAVISIYPPGKTTAIRTISKGLKGCGTLVFGAGYKTLYVIDQQIIQASFGFPGVVDVFDYATGTKTSVISEGFDPKIGILNSLAVDPPAQPGLPYH